MACGTIRSPPGCVAVAMLSRSGESGSLSSAWRAWRTGPGAGDRRLFPPQVRAEVIRLACERPADSEVPLARWSSAELAAEVIARGICEQLSGGDGLAVALRRRDQAVAVPLMDLPPRPRVHRQGRPDPRPLLRPLGRRAVASRRLCRVLR